MNASTVPPKVMTGGLTSARPSCPDHSDEGAFLFPTDKNAVPSCAPATRKRKVSPPLDEKGGAQMKIDAMMFICLAVLAPSTVSA
jgi:hypothetical protein